MVGARTPRLLSLVPGLLASLTMFFSVSSLNGLLNQLKKYVTSCKARIKEFIKPFSFANEHTHKKF